MVRTSPLVDVEDSIALIRYTNFELDINHIKQKADTLSSNLCVKKRPET